MKSIPTHALAIGLILATERRAQTADAIFHSGTILAISDNQPSVESVAVVEGRFIAAGSKAMVLKTKHHNTNLSNLKRRTILPGFVDTHGHVMGGGSQGLSENSLSPPDGFVTEMPVLQRTVRDWIKETEKVVGQIKVAETLKEAITIYRVSADRSQKENAQLYDRMAIALAFQ